MSNGVSANTQSGAALLNSPMPATAFLPPTDANFFGRRNVSHALSTGQRRHSAPALTRLLSENGNIDNSPLSDVEASDTDGVDQGKLIVPGSFPQSLREAGNEELLSAIGAEIEAGVQADKQTDKQTDRPAVSSAAKETKTAQQLSLYKPSDTQVQPAKWGWRDALPAAQMPGLIRMARLNAAPMGAGLVALGAYGARHAATFPLDSATMSRLVLSTLLTTMVTSTSMIVNDYYDWKHGVDNAVTKPNRPLVTGEVKPETVKFALKAAYTAQLGLISLVDRAPIRLWILSNALLTHHYSERLKPITGVKNASCAAIVSMALGLGAMAMTGSMKGLAEVWRPVAVVAGTIAHREMVMDIKDADGDKLAGVRTVPVVVGDKGRALTISLAPLALALAAAATAPGKVPKLVATAAMAAQAGMALNARRNQFSLPSLGRAIELAPAWLLAALVALTVK